MFGDDRARDWRVLVRVDLGPLGLAGRAEFAARASARRADGKSLPFAITRLAVEDHHGRRFLHLQCNGPRAELEGKQCTVVFDVSAR